MKRWLAAFACMAVPAAAGAQSMRSLPGPLDDAPKSRPAPNFRLVQESPVDPSPMRHSGMIMNTEVAPNTTFGLGFFKVTKKSGFMDWRPDSRAPSSRKVGVGIKVRF